LAPAGRDAAALERASKLGADAVGVLGEDAHLVDAYHAVADGTEDVIVDYTWGRPLEAALEVAGVGARVVQVGRAAGADVQLSADLMRAKSLNLLGYATYHVAHNVRAVAYQRLAQFAAEGELAVDLECLPLKRSHVHFDTQCDFPLEIKGGSTCGLVIRDAVRDDLITTVSHNLRTPLTAIKASVYSLRDSTSALGAEKRDRLLCSVEVEADRLVHFVTGVLELRRLANGPVPHWERMEPSEVVSAALDRCLPGLGAREVIFRVPDDLPAVRLDAALLDQALTMLLENVAVHTPPGSPLAIDGGLDDGALLLSISDAGPGVPSDARERIFQKYARRACRVKASAGTTPSARAGSPRSRRS
jgi:signal transduction histidine kinase